MNISDNYHKEKNTISVKTASNRVSVPGAQTVNLSVTFSELTKIDGITDIDFNYSTNDTIKPMDVWVSGNTVYFSVCNKGSYTQVANFTVKAFQLQ